MTLSIADRADRNVSDCEDRESTQWSVAIPIKSKAGYLVGIQRQRAADSCYKRICQSYARRVCGERDGRGELMQASFLHAIERFTAHRLQSANLPAPDAPAVVFQARWECNCWSSRDQQVMCSHAHTEMRYGAVSRAVACRLRPDSHARCDSGRR